MCVCARARARVGRSQGQRYRSGSTDRGRVRLGVSPIGGAGEGGTLLTRLGPLELPALGSLPAPEGAAQKKQEEAAEKVDLNSRGC